MSVSFANVSLVYDRQPPNYNAGETVTLTIIGQAVNTTGSSTVTEPIGPFTVTANADPSGAQTILDAPQGGTITRTVPGSSTNENVFFNAAAGSGLTLGGKFWIVSQDRRSVSTVA